MNIVVDNGLADDALVKELIGQCAELLISYSSSRTYRVTITDDKSTLTLEPL